jgi:hypothetical protein
MSFIGSRSFKTNVSQATRTPQLSFYCQWLGVTPCGFVHSKNDGHPEKRYAPDSGLEAKTARKATIPLLEYEAAPVSRSF